MLKVDLHIHTLWTAWDEPFEFDLNQLVQHVVEQKIDAIAITNHNTFDCEQYEEIAEALSGSCVVFPGVEVSALKSHNLLIVDKEDARKLEDSCRQIEDKLQNDVHRSLIYSDFVSAFPWLDTAIVVPHYQKDPEICQEAFDELGKSVSAVETSSIGKARRLNKQAQLNVPAVCFTDYRFGSDATICAGGRYHPGGVYLTTDSSSFGAIRNGIMTDVRLSADGSEDIEFAPGLTLVNGVNLLLGRRSTGKTYTLKRIEALFDSSDVCHIAQGELVREGVEDAFYDNLEKRFSGVRRSYMARLSSLMKKAKQNGSAPTRLQAIKDYLKRLKSYAETNSQSDCYSRCALHHARRLEQPKSRDTKELIDAVMRLLASTDNADLIERHVGRGQLFCLLGVLVDRATVEARREKCVELGNTVINTVRQSLKVSAVDEYPQPYLEEAFEKEIYSRRLVDLVESCWKQKLIADDKGALFSDYSIKVYRRKYTKANDLKAILGVDKSIQLQGITNKDAESYIDYLISLPGDFELSLGLFDVVVRMQDEKGAELSGGQRTECVFAGKLGEAYGKSVVLIDEPEASFDNPFLSKTIASKIKDLARNSTVVVATHNQVLGFDLNPDKVFLTRFDSQSKKYSILSGSPHDKLLISDGYNELTADAMLEILEAGKTSYDDRRDYYGGLGR